MTNYCINNVLNKKSKTTNIASLNIDEKSQKLFEKSFAYLHLYLVRSSCCSTLAAYQGHWCNPVTLKPEQSGGAGSIPGRTPPLERHDEGSRTRLALSYFCDPSAWR